MERKIRSIFFIMILMVYMLLPSKCVNAVRLELTDDILKTHEFIENSEEVYIDAFGENYLEIFEKNQLATDNVNKIISMFEKDANGKPIYPDYIGGIYIDDENKLVLQIVDENKPILNSKSKELQTYNKILNVDNNRILENVKNSYMKLESVQQVIEALFVEGLISDIVDEFYIDVINNKVVVGLDEYNEINVENFKQRVINSDVIIFKQSETITISGEVKPGAPINSIGCSVGYRARKNGIGSGFVTAGHCVSNNQVVTGFGTVQNRQYGGSIDAAWLNAAGSLGSTPVNTFHSYGGDSPTGSLSTSVASSYVVGQLVGRLGLKTYHKTGKITVVGYSFDYIDTSQCIQFTNQVVTDVTQGFGDSGGIVYLLSNKQTMGIGTFKQGTAFSDTGNMIFSRADLINFAFGIARY